MIKKIYGWPSEGQPAERLDLIGGFADLFARVNTEEPRDSIRDRIAQEIAIGGARIDRKLRQGAWCWELALRDGDDFVPVAAMFDRALGDDGGCFLLVK